MPEPDPDFSADVTQPVQPRPGTDPSAPSASHYAVELPYAEELQAMLEGRYVVESFLGQGGMGAVYKGLQMPLRRPVAIKILRKNQSGVEDDFAFEERFKREAYAMASLTHPNIVQVYDCGDAGDNFLFISMELLEGGDLSDAIKAGQCTPDVALRLIAQICDGLQAAHERGIVHRDVKPANIFLTADGRAKVADFGLAKKFDAKSTFVTKTGLGMGTPDYAAPEQFEGLSDLDHRADIYALGVMMYQMLTGKLPRGVYKLPSQIVPIDPRIDAVVSRAMMSEREDRWQSAAEIKQALQQIAAAPAKAAAAAAPIRTSAVPASAARPAASTPSRPAAHPAPRPAIATPPPPPPKKSSAGLLIGGLGAVTLLGGAAFFLFSKPKPKPETATTAPSATGATSPSSSAPDPAVTRPIPDKPPVTAPDPVFAGHRYRIVMGNITWPDASAKASVMGGHLATVTSREEHESLTSLLKDALKPRQNVWIGASRASKSTAWKWVAGEPFEFTAWAGGQPDASTEYDAFISYWRRDDGTVGWDDTPGTTTGRDGFIVEWDEAGASSPGAINLLSGLDLNRSKIEGTWTMQNGELVGDGQFARLALDYQPPAEYDFRIRFTRRTGQNSAAQHIVLNGHDVMWLMGGFGNKVCGFELVGGAGANANITTVNSGIQNGRMYESVVKVRRDRLQVLMDGRLVSNFKTDGSNLATNERWAFPDPGKLGIGCQQQTVFHSVELIPIASAPQPATATAPAPATATPPNAASSELPPAPTTPRQTLDLIALIDPAKDKVAAGNFTRANQWGKSGTLLSYTSDGGSGKIAAPVSVGNASDYECGLLVRRLSGAGPFTLDFPVSRTRQSSLDFSSTGIMLKLVNGQRQKIGGWPADATGDLRVVARVRFAPDRRTGAVTVTINGRPAAQWQGPLGDMGNPIEFHPDFPGEPVLSLFCFKDTFAFAAWQLRTYEGEARPLRGASTGTTVASTPAAPSASSKPPVRLFNGTDTTGWRYQGPDNAFVIEDACIKATGNRGNLMFVGLPGASPMMKDFILTMKVKTENQANSGVWIHSRRNNDGVSYANGMEVQIANENRDPEKTGSLWSVAPFSEIIVHDGEWFDFRIEVRGMTVTTFINGRQVVSWTQPDGWNGSKKKPDAILGEGTVGLQSNGGTVWFKDIELTQPKS